MFVIILLCVVLGAVGMSYALWQDNGYVLLSVGHWTFESSLVTFGVLLAAVMLVVFVSYRLLRGTWHLPGKVKQYHQRYRHRQARESITKGLIQLNEGHWKKAEKTLIGTVGESEIPLLSYLSAARAAQLQEAYDRRDRYLNLAYESTPDAKVAIWMTQAELQYAHGQYESAIDLLESLRVYVADNRWLLTLLLESYRKTGQWGRIESLLPDLKKAQKQDKADKLSGLMVDVYIELIRRTGSDHTPEALFALWKGLPRNVRRHIDAVDAYTQVLAELGQHQEAAKVIQRTLKEEWDERLVLRYGLLDRASPDTQLKSVRVWLRDRATNSALLLTAGRLALRAQLWGRAESYFEASLRSSPSPDCYFELAKLWRQLDKSSEAYEAYEAGLTLAITGEKIPTVEAALPGPEPSNMVDSGVS